MSQPASQTVEVPTDDGPMPAQLWLPDSGSGPGLVLLQEIFGLSPYIRSRAADLAAAGYVVLAPELYWRLDDSTIDESAPDAIERAMGLAGQLDWPTTLADAAAALEQLRDRPEVSGGTGVIGFCFGGALGYHLAAVAEPDVLVSYYGSSIPDLLDLAPQVTAPSLYHFGLADDFIPADVVQRIEEAVSGSADARFETYPGANHAFDNPDFLFHDAEASRLAWQRTLEFLRQRLSTS